MADIDRSNRITNDDGSYSEVYYFDSLGNLVDDQKKAKSCIIRKCLSDGTLVGEVFGYFGSDSDSEEKDDDLPEFESKIELYSLVWDNHERVLNLPVINIGRGRSNDIVIRNPYISGRHCYVEYRHGLWILYDNNSTNGTFVDGERIEQKIGYILQEGAVISLGKKVSLEVKQNGTVWEDETLWRCRNCSRGCPYILRFCPYCGQLRGF